RYKEKLAKKAKEVGAKDIDDLKEKLKDDIEETKKNLNKIDPLKELQEYEKKISAAELAKQKKIKLKKKSLNNSQINSQAESSGKFKTLDSFVDLSKISALPALELEMIWRARFAGKDNTLSAVISNEIFNRFYYNAKKNPCFVLPLPRKSQLEDHKQDEGIEIHYVQWSFVGENTTHCMITSLVEYKLHKEFARPHTTLMFHSELQKEKGVVLMNGVVDEESPITLQDAQLLLLNLQKFYGALQDSNATSRRLTLLNDFNSGNPNFSIEDLIKEAESLDN
ncbi:hypothetical protein PACTADRAFT_23946, partial [Pachysolen tannophilus NRRL Y-2460]